MKGSCHRQTRIVQVTAQIPRTISEVPAGDIGAVAKLQHTVTGDTLRLTDDRTFQLPAVTHYAVAGSVLTLTPPTGHGARQFTGR